jgi:uncharacterized membrane protein
MKNPVANKPLLAVLLIVLFVLAVVVTIVTYNSQSAPESLKPIVKFHFELMILIAVLGVGVGAATFYLMGEQVERKSQESRKNAELLLKFLSGDEKKVVERLLKNDGKAMQYELSRLEGLTRLKAHRIVGKLERQGIVAVEKIGKVNSVRLTEEFRESLL